MWIDFESIVFALPILAEMTYVWCGQWTKFTCRKYNAISEKCNSRLDNAMSIMANYVCTIFISSIISCVNYHCSISINCMEMQFHFVYKIN